MIIPFRSPFFYRTFLFIFFLELVSVFAYLLPSVNTFAFFALTVLALFLGLYRPTWALFLLFGELFIGSKGALFSLTIFHTTLPIRIALWLVVFGVWCARFLLDRDERLFMKNVFLRQRTLQLFLLFFAAVTLASVIGASRHAFADFFFDGNGWIFFLLLFPALSALRDETHFIALETMLFAATAWTSCKALFILFIYAHDPLGAIFLPTYHWVRDSGVGEITAVNATFARVFFQSQIYTLIALFIFLSRINKDARIGVFDAFFFILLLASLLLSFSRSFWIAALVTFVAYRIIRYFLERSFYPGMKESIFVIVAGMIAIGVIWGVMNFPYPRTQGGDFTDLLSDRVWVTEEAAIASRWSLLPPLLVAIREHWLFGDGFGATVTYQSRDPRIVASSVRGNNHYTTSAFEWGYLDIWLKMGIIGLTLYGVYLFSVGRGLALLSSPRAFGYFFAGIALLTTHMFSPYINHPLGIGFLVLLTVYEGLFDPVQKSSVHFGISR